MKGKRYSQEQKAYALKQVESGAAGDLPQPISFLCLNKFEISQYLS